MFGEKYGDRVRVLKMGDFSTELCGGTHVHNTSDIKVFKIVSESAVSSGVRRIEALTGRNAITFLSNHTRQHLAARSSAGLSNAWEVWTDASTDGAPETVNGILEKQREEIKRLEKELRKLKGQSVDLDRALESARPIGAFKWLSIQVPIDDRDALSAIADGLRDRLKSGVVLVAGQAATEGAGQPVLVTATKDAAAKLPAGQILKEFLAPLGGKGGGRPDFAQGAAPTLAKWSEAVAAVEAWMTTKV